jgi:hypothetical protein
MSTWGLRNPRHILRIFFHTSNIYQSEVDMNLPPDVLLEMQRRMLRIRRFDERASKMVKRGHIPGTVHTSIGQEAQVVGAAMALADGDYTSRRGPRRRRRRPARSRARRSSRVRSGRDCRESP